MMLGPSRFAVLVVCSVVVLGGCSRKKMETRDIMKPLSERWNTCLNVEVKGVKIESQDRKKIRFTYVLRMRGDGVLITANTIPCPMPLQKMLEAHFNKDVADLKAGDEATVTEEADKQ